MHLVLSKRIFAAKFVNFQERRPIPLVVIVVLLLLLLPGSTPAVSSFQISISQSFPLLVTLLPCHTPSPQKLKTNKFNAPLPSEDGHLIAYAHLRTTCLTWGYAENLMCWVKMRTFQYLVRFETFVEKTGTGIRFRSPIIIQQNRFSNKSIWLQNP